MDLILITGETEEAQLAEKIGIEYVMVDLETVGKAKRQKNTNSLLSGHTIQDVSKIRKQLFNSKLMVRINPISKASYKEINEVIELGADALLLPMFRKSAEVTEFLRLVNGRAECHLLLETATALARLDSILVSPGITSIHIGLNDLHIEMKLTFMFELLSSGLIDFACSKIKQAGIKFGIGGIGRVGGHSLIPPEIILQEHIRLGSKQVILSRDFKKIGPDENEFDIMKSITDLREIITELELDKPMNISHGPSETLKNLVNSVINSIELK